MRDVIQWNWDDRPRSRGCTWVYEIVGKLKCPKADTRERQVGVYLKNSISADDPKILALIRRDARADVGDHKQSLISHPKASYWF